MAERRFVKLRSTLLRSGVAVSCARRAVRELEVHYEQLVDDQLSRGEPLERARSEAHRKLGSDQSLVEAFAAQPELRAMCSRLPGVSFTFIPIFYFAAIVIATVMAISMLADWVTAHTIRVTDDVVAFVRFFGQGLVLWWLPMMASAFFARQAYRQGVPLGWPIVAIVLICTLGMFMDFTVVLVGPYAQGWVAAGVGLPKGHWLGAAVRALVTATIVIVPLFLAARPFTRQTRSEHLSRHQSSNAPTV
jgi:uncharacterized membrane protein